MSISLNGEVEEGGAFEEAVLPSGAGDGNAAHVAYDAGEAGGLGVDEAGGGGVEEFVSEVDVGESAADEVAEPLVDVVEAGLDAVFALGGAFGLGDGVDGFVGLFGFLGGLLLGAGGATFEPGGDPGGRCGVDEGGGVDGVEEQKADAVFAGELAAGAGAFECGLGEVDGGLVGGRSAALAFAPECYVGLLAGGQPFAFGGEALAGFGAGGVGGEAEYLFGREHVGDWCARVDPCLKSWAAWRSSSGRRGRWVVRWEGGGFLRGGGGRDRFLIKASDL